MRLNPVPAKTGLLWVQLGIRTFFRQPLALTGLFLLFMLVLSLVTLIPVLGNALALGLLPAATLGLMAATRDAATGKFPMPAVLVSAFRAGRERMRAMIELGAMYAVGFLAILGLSALFDGGQFAQIYLGTGEFSAQVVQRPEFQHAMWVGLILYMPLSMLFWHAPALVHWHGVTPVKSLFFSLLACWQNKGALTVFMLVWMGVFTIAGMVVSLIGLVFGGSDTSAALLFPAALVLAAMFFTSFYFTFRDSFVTDDGQPPA